MQKIVDAAAGREESLIPMGDPYWDVRNEVIAALPNLPVEVETEKLVEKVEEDQTPKEVEYKPIIQDAKPPASTHSEPRDPLLSRLIH